jgi:hypothetical protein
MISSPISSDDKYSMLQEALKVAIEGEDCQGKLAGTPMDTPLVCQLPCSPCLKIGLHYERL